MLTEERAKAIFLADPKVKDWLSRYPTAGRTTYANFKKEDGAWQVDVWWRNAGEIATGPR